MDSEIEKKIQEEIIPNVLHGNYDPAIEHLQEVLGELYRRIPEKKHISFGRVYTIQVLSKRIFSSLTETGANAYENGKTLLERANNFGSKGVALGILSYLGTTEYEKVLPFFEAAASSADWNMREFTQMFFRKIIKNRPDQMKEYLIGLTGSKDPNIRRFVSETLRPVRENSWLNEKPDYSLSILKNLFKESSEYPRTSVGNNLSDLARHHPDLVLEIAENLVASGDRNSFWIAYRACRNLVKKEPVKVLDLLHVDEYRYKKKVYRRSDYKRD